MIDQEHDDFKFIFKLEPRNPSLPNGPEALVELIRDQLRALLDVVVLTSGGKPVSVDGFMWMRDAYQSSSVESPSVQQLYQPPEH